MLREYRTILDISRTLSASQPGWPGDTAFALQWKGRIDDGDSVNLSSLTLSPHCATHVDAPLHFARNGATAHDLPPERFIGPCLVLDLRGPDRPDASPITRAALQSAVSEYGSDREIPPRLLLRTGYQVSDTFDENFPPLSPAAVHWMAERGVQLIGTDAPSVDAFASKDLPAHHACASGDICILEHLELTDIEPGPYTLIAPPISISGAEAAPVRALLLL